MLEKIIKVAINHRWLVMTLTVALIAILKEVGEHAEAGDSEPRGHKAGQCCGGCSH